MIVRKTPEQVDKMAAAGEILVRCLRMLATSARPGVTTAELDEAAGALFDLMRDGKLKVGIGQRFALSEAAAAHRALEGRQTTGSTLLIP